jgi:hypothetical protein
MPLGLDSLVKQLADSSIIAPGKLENLIPPKAHPTSVDEPVAELVKSNLLTAFQAAQVKAGGPRALILGAISRRLPPCGGCHFVELATVT